MKHILLGKRGEKLAYNYLSEKGYKILQQNYRCTIGEIDIVAEDCNCLVFVEVKARKSFKYGLPEEAITYHKKKKLRRVAQYYIAQHNITNKPLRFDCIGMVFGSDGLLQYFRHVIRIF